MVEPDVIYIYVYLYRSIYTYAWVRPETPPPGPRKIRVFCRAHPRGAGTPTSHPKLRFPFGFAHFMINLNHMFSYVYFFVFPVVSGRRHIFIYVCKRGGGPAVPSPLRLRRRVPCTRHANASDGTATTPHACQARSLACVLVVVAFAASKASDCSASSPSLPNAFQSSPPVHNSTSPP